MRGGKRKGAGRPKGEPTTVIRVPTRLVARIKGIIEDELSKAGDKPSGAMIGGFKVNSEQLKTIPGAHYPFLSKKELKIFRFWLVSSCGVKSISAARNMTSNPKRSKDCFLKYAQLVELSDSMSLVFNRYVVD